ncbi:hypothetical protein [Geotalea sp. SG265]|uniref:hypothetical protein n=1 Tax=Geotalea sp. SG265 TaxID=2922867 RepID=UPI001FB02600|nr:hypothetical protein [Geotalea sp. SG265]
MVFEVYGNYLEGIEEDYLDILEYFGRDFVEVKRTPLSSYKNLHCESLVKARGAKSVTA